MERELHEPVALCTPDGRLNPDAVGWARRPVHQCALPGSWGRRKRWDYWCVTAPGCVLSMTFADVDYLGLADVWFLDLATERTAAHGAMTPLGRGFMLPETVAGGSMAVQQRGTRLAITETPAGTRLAAHAEAFDADLLVARPDGHETMSVVIPWSATRFQCTTKENTRPVTGTVRWEDRTYTFGAEAWGCLDYGRGKWPYRTEWNWGSASGHSDGHVVGLQLGGKWTVGTGMTENAVCIDGRVAKVSDELAWSYDSGDWLRPWRISSPDGAVDLTFSPVYDKPTRMELGVASSTVHQCFGHYAGRALDARVDGLFGWAEEARWRW